MCVDIDRTGKNVMSEIEMLVRQITVVSKELHDSHSAIPPRDDVYAAAMSSVRRRRGSVTVISHPIVESDGEIGDDEPMENEKEKDTEVVEVPIEVSRMS